MAYSPYQAMWLLALFDLPTDTPDARREYTKFRTKLLECGFDMLQYSVYGRYCSGEEKARVHRQRIKSFLPPDGEVRIMSVTDVQFGKMQIFRGKLRQTPESGPEQIQMF